MGFQERRSEGARAKLERMGVDVPVGMDCIVEIQKTGNLQDQAMQTELYDNLNYDPVHESPYAIYMGCDEKNVKQYVDYTQEKSRKGLRSVERVNFRDPGVQQDDQDQEESSAELEAVTSGAPDDLVRNNFLRSESD